MILENPWRGVPLFERAKRHIADVDTVLDLGAGIRPQSLVACKRHICAEPHWEYAAELRKAGYETVRGGAPWVLEFLAERVDPVDTVVMLDVLEHMERGEGHDTIRFACELARRQVVVFTPLGFKEQDGGGEKDAWGMQGQAWQQHRSGWTLLDFPGWLSFVDKHFAPGHAAFVAIWNRP